VARGVEASRAAALPSGSGPPRDRSGRGGGVWRSTSRAARVSPLPVGSGRPRGWSGRGIRGWRPAARGALAAGTAALPVMSGRPTGGPDVGTGGGGRRRGARWPQGPRRCRSCQGGRGAGPDVRAEFGGRRRWAGVCAGCVVTGRVGADEGRVGPLGGGMSPTLWVAGRGVAGQVRAADGGPDVGAQGGGRPCRAGARATVLSVRSAGRRHGRASRRSSGPTSPRGRWRGRGLSAR